MRQFGMHPFELKDIELSDNEVQLVVAEKRKSKEQIY
jgi:hypothetical protein